MSDAEQLVSQIFKTLIFTLYFIVSMNTSVINNIEISD